MTDRQDTSIIYDPDFLGQTCGSLDLRMVILFGSRATGRPVPSAESDLDLAVLGNSPYSSKDFHKWYGPLSEVFFSFTLDLALLCTADPLFRHEIFRDGILLYGSLDDYYDKKMLAYRMFVDSYDLRALENALFIKKMAYIREELYGTS